MSTTPRRTLTHALVLSMLGALVFVLGLGSPAQAQEPIASSAVTGQFSRSLPAYARLMMPARVMRVAASKQGTPYRYGADGPRAFDCSGFTSWVFHRVGKNLPRTSAMQRLATKPVSRSHRERGDLVLFGSPVYHVGIYAGHNRIWHAPRTGSVVHRERLWTSAVRYGRVR